MAGVAVQRYFLSRVVGTGSFADKFRPKTLDVLANVPGVTVHAAIADGAGAGARCLVNVVADDLTALLGDADHTAFPAITLDARLSTLSTQTRNQILTFLTNQGIDVSGIQTTDAFRVLVRRVGRAFRSEFDENAFG